MKKLLSLILAALMLTSAAFAADTTITLTEEENSRIEELLIKDGNELFGEFYGYKTSGDLSRAKINCIYKSDKIIAFSYILGYYNEHYKKNN